MLTVLSFIFVLGILIFIHELGHFVVAKKVGIKVHKFSLGFPPDIISKKVGDTTYCIGLVPLGGYVKMAGEDPDETATGAENEFGSKSLLERTAVILAGPFMNYLLAIFVLIGVFYFGGKPIFDPKKIIVGNLVKKGPALKAGMKTDDQIIAVDGTIVPSFDSLRSLIMPRVNRPVEITWISNGDTVSKTMTTIPNPIALPDGTYDTIGVIGFNQKPIRYEYPTLGKAVAEGFIFTHVIVKETFVFVKKLITGNVSAKMIGGPLFIAQQSGKEAEKGAGSLFVFMALLSVNLAVLNIMPIPILDGGHLLFLLIERIKGSPVSIRARAISQQAGLVLLLTLIVIVTYNDIFRVIRGY